MLTDGRSRGRAARWCDRVAAAAAGLLRVRVLLAMPSLQAEEVALAVAALLSEALRKRSWACRWRAAVRVRAYRKINGESRTCRSRPAVCEELRRHERWSQNRPRNAHFHLIPDPTPGVGGQPVRSLFTPFDARADFILYPCRSPHGGRLTSPITPRHAHGPCACRRLGPSISAQGVLKWEGQRSRGRGLGGAPQERLPLHGRRGPTRPSSLRLGRAALDAVMPCRLWVLSWRDADASLCSGLLAAMPRCLCLRLEKNSAGRCHCCGPGCRRHRLSRGMW